MPEGFETLLVCKDMRAEMHALFVSISIVLCRVVVSEIVMAGGERMAFLLE